MYLYVYVPDFRPHMRISRSGCRCFMRNLLTEYLTAQGDTHLGSDHGHLIVLCKQSDDKIHFLFYHSPSNNIFRYKAIILHNSKILLAQ